MRFPIGDPLETSLYL